MKSTMRSRRPASPTRAPPTSSSLIKQPPVKGGTYDSELIRILRERDEMQSLLDKCERRLSESQANLRVLTAERDKTRIYYQQAQEEIAELRREVLKSKSFRGPKPGVTAQSILKRIEAERDEARSDLHHMTTERDSLRERLKILQETAISEKAHLEQRIEDLQSAMLTLEQERGEQKNRQTQMKEAVMGLEEEVKALSRKLAASHDEVSRFKNECGMLRLTTSQMENEWGETQRRLTNRIAELHSVQEKNKQLDERNDSLQRKVYALKEELRMMEGNFSELDRDRETLQEQLERKNELLSSANKQLEDKVNTIHSLHLQVEDLERTVEALRETVSSREEELDVTRKKLSDTGAELLGTLKVKEAMQRENDQLTEELDRTRMDKKSLELKIEEATQEIRNLEKKVQMYASDISRIEDLLTSKERECRELQEFKRRTSVQTESWEQQARQAEAAVAELRQELSNSETEKGKLREKMESLENSLQEAVNAERSCNAELVKINHTLHQREDELRQLQSEHSLAQQDLEMMRALCVKLDTSKEAIQQELTTCRSESELLRKQLASERASMRALESKLVNVREMELDMQLTFQERLTEIQFLRDKLSVAESMASTQSREMAQLSSRTSQLEADLESSRRQLSFERFERERAVQELRRLGLSSMHSSLLSTP